MNHPRDGRVAAPSAENLFVDRYVLGMLKMGFGYKETCFIIPIKLTGKPETAEPVFFKNRGPLAGFKGDTVGTGKPGGYKTDIFFHFKYRLSNATEI